VMFATLSFSRMSASSGVGREHDAPNIPRKTMKARRLMPHAIFRGASGRRHEVDFRRRAGSCRDLCQRRDRRDFHRDGFRYDAGKNVGASRFSTFPATCSAKPPPQRRDVPRTCPAFLLRWVKLQRFPECDSCETPVSPTGVSAVSATLAGHRHIAVAAPATETDQRSRASQEPPLLLGIIRVSTTTPAYQAIT
jgi:hypothetical protein